MPREPKARPSRLLRVGKIASAHGLAGAVNIYAYTHPPARILEYRPWFIGADPASARPCEPVRARVLPRRIVVELEGVRDRTAAEALRGRWIFVERAQVPAGEGEYLWDELVGCPVRTEEEALEWARRLRESGGVDVAAVIVAVSDGDEAYTVMAVVAPTGERSARLTYRAFAEYRKQWVANVVLDLIRRLAMSPTS